MKKLLNISHDNYFYLLLSFLLMINFSIAYCYISAALLLFILILDCIIHRRIPIIPKVFYAFLPYIFFTLISTVFSINPSNSFKDNKELLIFLLFPIFVAIINSRKRLLHSLFTILLSTFISSLIGIFITIRDWRIDTDFRLKGLTSHWMTYSGLLMLVFIFFFVYLFYEKKKNARIMIFSLLFIILITIVFSLTRSIWIGTGISLSIFLVYYKPRIIIYLIPIVIILAIILPEPVKNRFISIFDLKSESNKDRIIMYQIGYNIFKKHPLVGVGANNIQKFYKDNLPESLSKEEKDKIRLNMHLHNNFLHILAERGIFALISFLLAFIYLFILLIKQIKSADQFIKTIALGTTFCLTGFLIAGFFEYNFGDSEILFLLFFLISIPFLSLKERKNAELQ